MTEPAPVSTDSVITVRIQTVGVKWTRVSRVTPVLCVIDRRPPAALRLSFATHMLTVTSAREQSSVFVKLVSKVMGSPVWRLTRVLHPTEVAAA